MEGFEYILSCRFCGTRWLIFRGGAGGNGDTADSIIHGHDINCPNLVKKLQS